jgi:transposase
MKKYSEKFKLKVVKAYLSGEAGYTTIAQENNVSRSLVRRWVDFYKFFGIDGLKRKTARYDAAFKLSVLQHMWENSLSYGQAAAMFNIRDQCAVGNWDRAFESGGVAALEPRPPGRPKKMPDAKQKTTPAPRFDPRTREEILAENEQLRMEVAYLKKLEALDQAKKAALRKKRG